MYRKGVVSINSLIAPNHALAPRPVQATLTVGHVFIKKDKHQILHKSVTSMNGKTFIICISYIPSGSMISTSIGSTFAVLNRVRNVKKMNCSPFMTKSLM